MTTETKQMLDAKELGYLSFMDGRSCPYVISKKEALLYQAWWVGYYTAEKDSKDGTLREQGLGDVDAPL